MLGRALSCALSAQDKIVGMDLSRAQGTESRLARFIECDITDRDRTIETVESVSPDIVIHTAAYTDVDGCERNPKKTHTVNAEGTKTIALACQDCGAFLYYISTDFVFDGEKKAAYTEVDCPNPINIYGKSKLEGEKYIQSILRKFIIIRSSWLFGPGGRNFVETILERARSQGKLKVVNDQFGSPTYTQDLAQAVGRLIGLSEQLTLNGIYHITNSGSCSWYEFALAIKEIAGLATDIIPISSESYASCVRRPRVSILENRRYQQTGEGNLRNWQEALKEYLAK